RLGLQLAARDARLAEPWVRSLLRGELGGRREGVEVDLFGNPFRKYAGGRRVERQSHLEKDVLEAHDAQADRTPVDVRPLGGRNRVEVEIDHPVELTDGDTDRARELLEVECNGAARRLGDVTRQIDRAEIA